MKGAGEAGGSPRRGGAFFAVAAGVVAAVTLAACASAVTPAVPVSVSAASEPLATSLEGAAGGWAVVPMGGSPSFWQIFTRSATGTGWRLVTPPAVASNGGLVATAAAGTVVVAFRPSQNLTFSPLAITTDAGQSWTADLVDARLAGTPDALAAASGGRMLALLQDGTVLSGVSSPGGTAWHVLGAPHAIAVSAPGRRCRLTGLTAVSFGSAGEPLVAGSCDAAGVAGVFAWAGGTWHAAGPVVPAALARSRVRVLRMTASATLLGSGSSLAIAWPGQAAAVVLPGTGEPLSSGFGAGGAAWALLSAGRAAAISGPGGSWRTLPAVPSGTVSLAPGPSGSWEALAVAGSILTVWKLGTLWDQVQRVNVPIQQGSSS